MAVTADAPVADVVMAPADPMVGDTTTGNVEAAPTPKRDVEAIDTTAWPNEPPSKKSKADAAPAPTSAANPEASRADGTSATTSQPAETVPEQESKGGGLKEAARDLATQNDKDKETATDQATQNDEVKEAARDLATQNDKDKETATDQATQNDEVKEAPTDQATQNDEVKEAPTDQATQIDEVKDAPTDQATQNDEVKEAPTDHAAQNDEVKEAATEKGTEDGDNKEATKIEPVAKEVAVDDDRAAVPATKEAAGSSDATKADGTARSTADLINVRRAVTAEYASHSLLRLAKAPVTALCGFEGDAPVSSNGPVWESVGALASWLPLLAARAVNVVAASEAGANVALVSNHLVTNEFKGKTMAAVHAAPVEALAGVGPETLSWLTTAGVTSVLGLAAWLPGRAAVAISAAAEFEEVNGEKNLSDSAPPVEQTHSEAKAPVAVTSNGIHEPDDKATGSADIVTVKGDKKPTAAAINGDTPAEAVEVDAMEGHTKSGKTDETAEQNKDAE